MLKDQLNRAVVLEYNYAPNQDAVRVKGFNGEELVTVIEWRNITVHKTYKTSPLNPNWPVNETLRVVDKVRLPTQAGNLAYAFDYNANTANPSVGWGELAHITLPDDPNNGPAAPTSSYLYAQDNTNGSTVKAAHITRNRPVQKSVSYSEEYDGTLTPRTEGWTYAPVYDLETLTEITTTAPDGGQTTEYTNWQTYLVAHGSGSEIYKTARPDGSVTELYYQNNVPANVPAGPAPNRYVKYEFSSVRDAGNTLVKTAIKEYNRDKNGNVTQVKEYDWQPYSSVPRDGNGHPNGLPIGATPVRVTVTGYYHGTPEASDSTTYDADAYYLAAAPLVRQAVEYSETQNASGSVTYARSESFYDNPATTANLTQSKSWDSTKGSLTRPLTAGNAVSVTTQYDGYGNPQLRTDARGTQTQMPYGAVNGYTGLYPTQSITAYGTSVARTATTEYDYWTGLVTRATDADNNVAAATTYDVFGRPTLVKAAEGKTEETRTATEYNAPARRVVVRADLTTLGDGKLVSITHYDQLGRVRLSRRLEDAATQSVTNEEQGLKVQTRYQRYNGGYTYQVSSNPYRAATSGAAGGETTMGWARSKTDSGGRLVEAQVFGGAALPAPWGSNTASTGTVTTAYDANFVTVTDQDGKTRRSMTDGLGRLARVDEPDSSGALGSLTAPNQATSYTYDVFNNLTQVVQGVQTRTFGYTSLSRLQSATNPESGTTSYTYDNGGNLLTRSDALSRTSTYTYDVLSRNLTVTYSDGTPTVTRSYDSPSLSYGKGRLWQTETNGSEGARTQITGFDALGRPLSQTQQFYAGGAWSAAYSTSQSYNKASAVVTQTYPSGHSITNGFDAAGRLSAYSGNLGDGTTRTYATGLTYAPTGALAQEQYGTQTAVYHKAYYNSRGQLSEIRVSTTPNDTSWNRGAIINQYSHQCWGAGCNGTDNNGNLKKQEVYLPHDDAITNYTAWYQQYDYDPLNRVQRVHEYTGDTSKDWQQEYAYDRYGNRTIHQTNTWGTNIPKPSFTPNTSNNRLTPAAGTMSYDAVGNLTYDSYTGEGTRSYDGENRLVAAWANNQWQEYRYNGEGQRVRRTANSVTTWQVYGIGGELLAEYAASGAATSPQQEYGYRGGQLLVTAEPNSNNDNVQWLIADHLGTPRMILDRTGALSGVKRVDNLPFGEELTASSGLRSSGLGYAANTVRQGFTGYEEDAETGLDYAVNRYYSPLCGRFITPDSYVIILEMRKARGKDEQQQTLLQYIAQPQVWNKYAYTLNNPLKYVDPDGRREMNARDRQAIDKLNNEGIRLAQAGENEAAAAVFKAIEEIMAAINAVPEGKQDPFGLRVVLNAIDQIGRNDYGQNGKVSFTSNGISITYDKGTDKCNVFVAFNYASGRAGNGFNGKHGYPANKDEHGNWWVPVANDLANPNSQNTGNLGVVTGSPMLGDVVAWSRDGSPGHSAIYIGGGAVVYAGTAPNDAPVKVNTLNGVQGSDRKLSTPTIRRLKP